MRRLRADSIVAENAKVTNIPGDERASRGRRVVELCQVRKTGHSDVVDAHRIGAAAAQLLGDGRSEVLVQVEGHRAAGIAFALSLISASISSGQAA
jgi:hypothetical protein